jgi:hypothetical protein
MLHVSAAMSANHQRAFTMKSTGIVVRTWNDAPITRRDSDGYADATAMCQANGKLWGHYRETQRTTDYIAALADATGLSPDQLIISTKGGPAHLQGTWIHPRLAVDLARWISPAFAVWMDGWFLEAIQSPQPLAIKHCARCGKQIESGTSRRYCSNACKQADWRNRKALAPSKPTLTTGIHVVAPTPRRAAEIWYEATQQEVLGALSRRLNPYSRTDIGLPIARSYNFIEQAPKPPTGPMAVNEWTFRPGLVNRGLPSPQTAPNHPVPVKRAAHLSWFVGRDFPWLSWWQELVLNWVASWATVGVLVVTAADSDEQAEWHLPTDLELQKMELEELLQIES